MERRNKLERERIKLLKTTLGFIEKAKPEVAIKLISTLKKENIIPNMHVGNKDLWVNPTAQQTVEWLLGGILDILEKKAWHCVNSWINYTTSYLQKI